MPAQRKDSPSEGVPKLGGSVSSIAKARREDASDVFQVQGWAANCSTNTCEWRLTRRDSMEHWVSAAVSDPLMGLCVAWYVLRVTSP